MAFAIGGWFDRLTMSGGGWFDKLTMSGGGWFDKLTMSGGARWGRTARPPVAKRCNPCQNRPKP